MMRKKCFIGILVALCVCFVATSCSKNDDFREIVTEEFSKNFKALVMGGKTINPSQDWSTVASIQVEVGVNYNDNQEYTVYIYQNPPVLNVDAAYIGMAKVKSGTSKTVCVIKPAQVGLLYAACFDESGHAFCKPFVAKATDCSVFFQGKSEVNSTISTSNRWSVPVKNAPNVDKFISGNLIEMTDAINETGREDSSEKHLRITKKYNGVVNRLSQFDNQTIYVVNTWTLTFDQRVTHGNMIIVGNGGKIVVPKGFKLTTMSANSDVPHGFIYVMPGGEITGDGIVEFTNDTGAYSYNAGTITAKTISVNSGTLYNEGMLGKYDSNVTELTGSANAGETPGILENHGYALLTNTGGDALSIQNAANIQVAGELSISSSSKMDDGAYTECATLSLNGDTSGDKILYMGNAAYLTCTGDISIDNYGIWGPSGNGYQSNAILKINNCSYCNTTDGFASTYLLDHVELILPDDYPTIFDDGSIREWDSDIKSYGIGTLSPTYSGYYSIRLLYDWMNGYQGKIIDVSNYQWTTDSNSKHNYTWSGSTEPFAMGVDESRQTCVYAHGPSYSVNGADYSGYHVSFQKSYDTTPVTNYIYYAFEIANDSHDFNYNDLILRIGTPTDNNDGSFSAMVEIVAVGTTLNTTVELDNKTFGKEIHLAIGTSTTANISKINRLFRGMDTLTFNTSNFLLDKLPFKLYVVNSNNAENPFSRVEPILYEAPTFIVVSGSGTGKWFWPVDKMNIGLAYPLFNVWANNMLAAPDWYNEKNAANGKVLIW